MTNKEKIMLTEVIDALLKELARVGAKAPLPYVVEDGALWMLAETRDGLQYRCPICKL